MVAEDRQRIMKYIAERHVMVLCTSGDGGPWSTPLFYAAHGARLYFLSNPQTRHCQHLAAEPRVSGTITEAYQDWLQIQGVQLEGDVRPLTGVVERAQALALYVSRFPALKAVLGPAGKLAAAFAKARFYELTIRRAWMTDNPSGFGTRWQADLTEPGAPDADQV